MIRFGLALWSALFWRFRGWESPVPSNLHQPVWVTDHFNLAELCGFLQGVSSPCRVLIPVSPGRVVKVRTRWIARGLGVHDFHTAGEAVSSIREAHARWEAVLVLAGNMDRGEVVELIRQTQGSLIPFEAIRLDQPGLGRPDPSLEEWPFRGEFRYHIGEPIAAESLTVEAWARARMDLQRRALEEHPALGGHLAAWIVRNLRRRFFQTVFTDAYQNDRSLKGGMLLGIAWKLADWIRHHIPAERVGVVLPPGLGATIANLACLLADKTPVNLNFTMGRAANEKAIAAAGITHILTAEAFVSKLGDFPWTEERIDLTRLLQGFGKAALLARCLRVWLTPAGLLPGHIGVPRHGGDREAGLLFTSGSSGDPKGVPLSHRNIMANILQVDAILPASRIKSLLGCLPIFHSFGFTVTLWWPLAGGPRVVSYISPLDSSKLADIIQRHAISLLITTPTFLRSLVRKAAPGQLSPLALVVTGAEKLPTPLLEEFQEKTGVPVCEGYGMTEACPVISTNLTDDVVAAAGGRLPGRTIGSVGRPLYGIHVRVCHPETEEDLPLHATGMLWYRGANVFQGYLNDPAKTAQVLREGWYVSGDIGHLDADGFLYIDGRLSRFSKIAGEMVPHGTVEMHLLDVLRGRDGSDFGLAVVGVRDSQKGEALVVLTTLEIDPEVIRKGMAAKGLPNLWIPRQFFRVEAVPTLASGKLDLRKCQELAEHLLVQK